jgi:hypothetical protein
MSYRTQGRMLLLIVAFIAALNIRQCANPGNPIWIINGMLAAILIAQSAHIYKIAWCEA